MIETNELLDQTTESFLSIELRVTPRRWLILLFYFLGAAAGAAVSITLTPCALLVKDAYDVPLLEVNMCSLCFGVTCVPMFFISMKMYTVLSTATTLRIGAFLLVLGCWIRQISTFDGNQFWSILVGSCVISLAGPIFLSAQNILCNKWFSDNERAIVSAVTGLAIPIGSVMAFT